MIPLCKKKTVKLNDKFNDTKNFKTFIKIAVVVFILENLEKLVITTEACHIKIFKTQNV